MTTFKGILDADLGNMLSDKEFGDSVTFTPQVGAAQTIAGIFDSMPVEVPAGEGEVFVRSSGPVLTVRLSDFNVVPLQNDVFTIDGVDYVIQDIEPDGTGEAVIYLDKV